MEKYGTKEWLEKMHSVWERFVNLAEIDDKVVRPIVAKSWLRSKRYGVDPYKINYGAFSNTYEISRRTENSKYLISIAYPHILAQTRALKDEEILINLSDSDGYILISEGDEKAIRNLTLLNRNVGICRDERITGTTAISLALTEDTPIQLIAYEHYNKNFHEWTCSAAPIHDQEGKIIGIINLSAHYTRVSRYSLGLVMQIAKLIESELKNIQYMDNLKYYQELGKTILESIDEGIVVFNELGKVKHSNQKGIEILKYIVEDGDITNLRELVKSDNIFKLGNEIKDREILIKKYNTKRIFYITSKDIISENGEEGNKILLFRENKNSIQKVSRYYNNNRCFYTFDDIVGDHKTIINAIRDADLASRSSCSVLIMGETGTGKEMFAQAIHNASVRQGGHFIAINCSAIPIELFEAELFGYEEGSFTGAVKGGKKGLIEAASGGTIFLDEINTLSLNMQIKLLRVLETKMVRRVGGRYDIPVDIRVISASTEDLLELVRKGTFRSDLFFRLNIISIILPPLRERKSDIPKLCDYFLKHLNASGDKSIIGISKDTEKIFMSYDWLGNVRELKGCLERACLFEEGKYITPKSLPPYILEQAKIQVNEITIDQEASLIDYELRLIEDTIKKCNGNISKASRILGISRDTIYRKVRKYKENK